MTTAELDLIELYRLKAKSKDYAILSAVLFVFADVFGALLKHVPTEGVPYEIVGAIMIGGFCLTGIFGLLFLIYLILYFISK